jgi:hypothetical protein
VAFGNAEQDELISIADPTISSGTASTAERPLVFDTGAKDSIPPKLFWISVSVAFLSANTPPQVINAICVRLMQLFGYGSGELRKLEQTADTFVNNVLLPVEEALFLACLFVVGYPVIKSLPKATEIVRTANVRRIVGFAVSLAIGLSILVFPYSYPSGLNSHASGVAGLGRDFARMSGALFQELDPMVHKRMLKPALAHFMHSHGYIAYYLFSLVLTFVLICLIVAFIESRFPPGATAGHDRPLTYSGVRWLAYLSFLTSSFMMVDFLWPGYSDNLSYILMLLIVLLPMSPQCRLATVALSVLNHDGIALALIPLILFAFPRKEKLRSLIVIGIFYGIMIASFGFSLVSWFQAQGSLDPSGTVWARMAQHPGLFLAGLFFTYKVFWLLLIPITLMLWRTKNRATLSLLLSMTLFPVALTTFGWDTTRVAGFGWLGMALAFGLLLKESLRLPRMYQYSAITLLCINLLIPSYNVVTYYDDSLSAYPYRGLYSLIDSAVRQVWL